MPFTEVMPERMRRAISRPCFLENTAPARPYLPALVSRTASSMSRTGLMASVGPNVSSVMAVDVSGTCVRMVGCTKRSPTASTPPSTAVAPASIASCTWLRITSTWDGMVMGPILAPGSPPARRPLACSVISATKESKTRSCTYTRSVPMQVWPAFDMPPQRAASAAFAMSASSSTMSESLPPASMTTGVRRSAQAAMTFLPVAVEPVKASLSTPDVHSAAPVGPRPVMACSTGMPPTTSENVSASQTPTPGVYSLGLNTTVLPAASA